MPKFTKKELSPAKIATTIHIHKRVFCTKKKLHTQRAIKEIVREAQKTMGTETVKVDEELNSRIWTHGRSNPPTRVRVVMDRKADEETGKMYTVVSYQDVPSFKGLHTEKILDQ